MMLMKEATAEAKRLGMVLRRCYGGYRVNRKGAHDSYAYYTDDLDDAVTTMRVMVKTDNCALCDKPRDEHKLPGMYCRYVAPGRH